MLKNNSDSAKDLYEIPLNKNFLSERDVLVTRLNIYNSYLKDRIDYIAKFICKVFDYKFEQWQFYDASGSDISAFDKITNQVDCVDVSIESTRNNEGCEENFTILLKEENGNDREWDLNYEFPKRWLTENFEEELKNGKIAYFNNFKKEDFLKRIKTKLTNDEMKVLTTLLNESKLA